jgi:hypothetical protein
MRFAYQQNQEKVGSENCVTTKWPQKQHYVVIRWTVNLRWIGKQRKQLGLLCDQPVDVETENIVTEENQAGSSKAQTSKYRSVCHDFKYVN